MNAAPHRTLIAGVFLLLAAGPVVRSAADPVSVQVTFQEFNPFLPWQTTSPSVRSGYAVHLGNGKLLTTEALVRNATQVEFSLPQSGRKHQAEIVIQDSTVNLALLSGSNEILSALPGVRPAEKIHQDEPFVLRQFNDQQAVQRAEARLVQQAVRPLPNDPGLLLQLSFLSDTTVNGQGVPILQENDLAGIIISFDRRSREAHAVASHTIRLFLEDAAQPPYTGFPAAGFLWTPLNDPVKRLALGLTTHAGGILVTETIPGSGADLAFNTRDVILAWNDFPIDEQGFYMDPEFGRLQIAHLTSGRSRAGEQASVQIFRNGRVQNVLVNLKARHTLDLYIPENVTGTAQPYLIEGGLIFQELSGRYLRAHGGDWMSAVDARVAHLYLTQQFFPPAPRQRIVMLSGVLPDPVNVGYHEFHNRIVTHANDHKVHNIKDLIRIKEQEGLITRIQMLSVGVPLVLDENKLPDANHRIQQTYRIPDLVRSPTEKLPPQ